MLTKLGWGERSRPPASLSADYRASTQTLLSLGGCASATSRRHSRFQNHKIISLLSYATGLVLPRWSANLRTRRKAPRADLLSRPLGVAVLADHRRRARRAVCQEAQARRRARHRERYRGALRRQPDRGARCAAHARSARHRRDQDGQGRRRAGGARQSAAVRRGARGAARSHRRHRRRDHGRAARHRVPRRRACRRERHRRRHRAAARSSSPMPKRAWTTPCASRELGAAFHLAVAEASHNRVLVVQLISLQHVSWPRRNPTMTRRSRSAFSTFTRSCWR